MKNKTFRFLLVFSFSLPTAIGTHLSYAQNVGIGTLTPKSKVHVDGSADTTQLLIEAHSSQSNNHPLIKLRSSSGVDLMWIHSDDPSNIFIGRNAGRVNNYIGNGYRNTFIGTNAGDFNTIGFSNTAVGYYSLHYNTTGNNNTALGMHSLYFNTEGHSNAGYGAYSLYNNTTGDFNTANGIRALHANNQGSHNTATGTEALYSNTTGNYNTASGYRSLYINTTGIYNTAHGNFSLYANTIGNYNTAIGNFSLSSNLTGTYNTASGTQSLNSTTNGDFNAAHGAGALYSNVSGDYNTAIGRDALYENTTGNYNTAIGGSASFSSSLLNNTTCLGYNAGNNVNASNRVEIGNTSVSWIGGQVAWSTYSDARIKDNVIANVPGLAFITRLRPVTYNLNIHDQNEMINAGRKEEGEWQEKYDIEKIRMTGFIAQEVEQAAIAAGYDFSGIDKPQNENELYSIRYSEFVMPLVKAVQEINEELKSQAENLRAENDLLIQRIEKLEELLIPRY